LMSRMDIWELLMERGGRVGGGSGNLKYEGKSGVRKETSSGVAELMRQEGARTTS
jgi:hypothetical protein